MHFAFIVYARNVRRGETLSRPHAIVEMKQFDVDSTGVADSAFKPTRPPPAPYKNRDRSSGVGTRQVLRLPNQR